MSPTFASLADARASMTSDRLLSSRRSGARARSHNRYVPQLSMTCECLRLARSPRARDDPRRAAADAPVPPAASPLVRFALRSPFTPSTPSLLALARPSTLASRPALVLANSPDSPHARLAGTAPRRLRRLRSPSWTASARRAYAQKSKLKTLARSFSLLADARASPASDRLLSAQRSGARARSHNRYVHQLSMICECLRLALRPRAPADPRKEPQLTPLSHTQLLPSFGPPLRSSLTPFISSLLALAVARP